jgi:hypothetical protein
MHDLVQRTSVADYASRFYELCNELPVESRDSEWVRRSFVRGLKEGIRSHAHARSLSPDATLAIIVGFAESMDNELMSTRRLLARPSSSGFSGGGGASGSFRDSSGSRRSSAMTGVQYGGMSVSSDERRKLRAENRCFMCKQQGRHAQGCSSEFVFRAYGFDNPVSNDSDVNGTNGQQQQE